MTEPNVAIVGVGQSMHARRRDDVDYAELAFEAVEEALADAGIDLNQIDHAVTASSDFLDGRTISSMSTAEIVGSFLKPESRIVGDAAGAVLYAVAKMRAGNYSFGLVVAHAKESHGNPHTIGNAAFDPFTQRRLGIDEEALAGLAAQRFFSSTAADPRAAAAEIVRAREAVPSNPKLEPLDQVSVEEVLDSPLLATPLRRLDRAPRSDASCAIVVASEKAAEQLDVRPVWITGVGAATDAYWNDRDLAATEALDTAVAALTVHTGWSPADADVVELTAQYGYQVLQYGPSLGIDGDAGPTLNPSGGALAGSPPIVSGLDRVVECVHQLRGTAEGRQVNGATRAIAHGFHGLAAQCHSLVALEGGV